MTADAKIVTGGAQDRALRAARAIGRMPEETHG